MTLAVRDIVNDLGVTKITVWRWIKEGEIKGVMANRRVGWKIEEEEYRAFLDRHPKWRIIHEGEAYRRTDIEARENALVAVTSRIISSKASVAMENHSDEYRKGFTRAINDIQAAITCELARKAPEVAV